MGGKANKFPTKQKTHCCCWLLPAGGWLHVTRGTDLSSERLHTSLVSLTYLFTGESHINANVILTCALVIRMRFQNQLNFLYVPGRTLCRLPHLPWCPCTSSFFLTLGDVISLTTNDADPMSTEHSTAQCTRMAFSFVCAGSSTDYTLEKYRSTVW